MMSCILRRMHCPVYYHRLHAVYDTIQTTLACGSTEIYERQMHLAKYDDMLADHCKKALSGPLSIRSHTRALKRLSCRVCNRSASLLRDCCEPP